MLYLDTSALLKLYIREEGSEWVQEQISAQDCALPIWEIQEAEFINALHLKVFWGDISLSQAKEQITFFKERRARGLYVFPEISRSALMESFRKLCEETPRLGCRTMDILHVACALEIEASGFISFDKRQCDLAHHAGLKVVVEIKKLES